MNFFRGFNIQGSHTRKVLETAMQWYRWQFLSLNRHVSADKITTIVAISYVFWAVRMLKMLLWQRLHPGHYWGSLQHSPSPPSCCLSLYLNIAGSWQGPGKCSWGYVKSWKSAEFFVSEPWTYLRSNFTEWDSPRSCREWGENGALSRKIPGGKIRHCRSHGEINYWLIDYWLIYAI